MIKLEDVPLVCAHICLKEHDLYGRRSHDIIQMLVPKVRTELGTKVFKYASPSAWNNQIDHYWGVEVNLKRTENRILLVHVIAIIP